MAETLTLIEKIEATLDTVRPYLHKDGGDIELVQLTDDMVVELRLLGNCVSCSMSFMTMKVGVEEALKKSIPEIKDVIAINMIENQPAH